MIATGAPDQQLQRILESVEKVVDSIDVFRISKATVSDSTVTITLVVSTSEFVAGDEGLPVQRFEKLAITFDRSFPYSVPRATVDHWRWVGFPHVLQGTVLCLFLDPATEWDPGTGAAGFLARLWDWLATAMPGEFDPATSLYHPVGGVLHRTPGASTVVVDKALPFDGSTLRFQRIALQRKSPYRIDVAAWHRDKTLAGIHTGLLVVLPQMLPFGAGHHLSTLITIVGQQQSNGARKKLLKKLRQTAADLKLNEPLQIVFAVPNQAQSGDSRLHLIAASIAHQNIEATLEASSSHRSGQPAPEGEPAVEWLYVDDVREAIHVRRDAERPTDAFAGLSIEMWGCGALGSWLAELLIRANIARIVLRDPGIVTKGLLVRQNYTELDVGRPKAEALADRLLAINNNLDVRSVVGGCEGALVNPEPCDLIIDATVNTRVASMIEACQKAGELAAPIVQIATDNDTATLGIITICQPKSGHSTNDVDEALRTRCTNDANLTPFMTFWDHDSTPPLTPSQGCSVPTFRGSSADAAAVAADGISLIATALRRRLSGGYLFATSHSNRSLPGQTHVGLDVVA